jgi:hypothetical protein
VATIIDYKESLNVSRNDPSFAALIWALCRKADSDNIEKLRRMWPELVAEFQTRYNALGGAINDAELIWLGNHPEA